MSMSEKEVEAQRERAWRRRAKGHPTRWRMLRDAVAVLSLGWMTISEFQIAMRRLWALKNSTSRLMLDELAEEGAVTQEKSDQVYKWASTKSGADFWIRDVKAIPAGIVEVAVTSKLVSAFEVSKT